MDKSVSEGESVLRTLGKHVADLDTSKIPDKIREAMDRDLSHIR